jgi:hypothetical protein
MQQLRSYVYRAINQLLEGSCRGSEVQLLVLPLALQDVLQGVIPDACLTGASKVFEFAVWCCGWRPLQLWPRV